MSSTRNPDPPQSNCVPGFGFKSCSALAGVALDTRDRLSQRPRFVEHALADARAGRIKDKYEGLLDRVTPYTQVDPTQDRTRWAEICRAFNV
jgi:hypothetical protein